nr:MAG TPA: crystallin beta/gamma motif-containing protein [Caudoviricetes sp.]
MDLLQDALARRDNLLQAFNRNPDQAAELRRIAQETNTPAGFVDDHTRALHRLNGLEQSLSGLSILPTAIRRSLNFATLAQDDMETLASLEKVSQARQRRRAQQEREYQAQYRAMQPNILEENRDNFFAGMRDFFNKRDLKTAVERQAELEQFNRGEGFEGLHYQISELEKAAAEEGGMDKLSPEAQQQYRELIARREGMPAEISGERDQAIADYLEDAASIAAVPRSDKTQAQMEALGQMQGADKIFYVLENPRTLAQTVSGSAGYMAPALAATVGATATAGPGAGMTAAGAGSYIGERSATIADRLEQLAQARGGLSGLRLEEVRDLIAGADVDEIISAANRRGAAVGLFDALSMGVAGKIAGWGSRTGRHVSAAGAGIAASMGMGAAGEAAGQIADRGEVHDWGDIGLEAVAEIATGGTELASAYAHLGIEGMKKEQAADLENLTAMTDAARASKLHQRAPDVFRGWTEQIEENADIQHYYVDGNALHQSGLVAALETALPDRVGEIRQALATGGTVQIPAADILTKIAPDKRLEDAITPHLRTADGLSLHELETTGQTELEGDIARNVERAERAAAQQTEADAIRDDIAAQLTATGRMTADASTANAALPAAFYQTVAERLGISVREAYEKYKLKVVGEPLVGLNQAMPDVTALINGAKEKIRNFVQGWRNKQGGKPFVDYLEVNEEAVQEASQHGLDIAGYRHVISDEAVNHIISRHSDQKVETTRAQIALTDADLETIADVVSTPDRRVYGMKTKDGLDIIASIKRMPDGTLSLVEEVRTGRRKLAVKTLRKHVAATDFNRITQVLLSNARSDGNHANIRIVDIKRNHTPAANNGQDILNQDPAPSGDFSAQATEQQRQFEETAQQYGGEAAYEQAKAAGKTNLSYHQWVQVRTPAFKAWFGDWENNPAEASKVIDPQTGEPLVVYHGTPNASFDVFDARMEGQNTGAANEEHGLGGFYFTTDASIADTYARTVELEIAIVAERQFGIQPKEDLPSPAIYPVFLNIRNPLQAEGAISRTRINQAHAENRDGIIKPGSYPETVAFNPNQIKSAIGNNGAFDANHDSILQQNKGAPRGAFDPNTNTIALLEQADLSTFIHELGHFYFETLTRIANDLRARDNAAGGGTLTEGEIQILKDVNTLIGKAGHTLDDWNRMTLEERRYHHETVARQFEAYLMEGKAPSVELQGIFSRLRSWLFAVYRNWRGLGVTLDDDVRQVFDRMLASDEAIQIAEQNRSMMPLFTTPEAAGMTAEQFADYQRQFQGASDAALDEMSLRMLADAKAIGRLKHKALKAKTKEAKILRGETEIEARRAIMAQPVYRVWQMLTGKMNADTTIASNKRPWSDAVVPEHDDLFTAIAKLGGINRQEIERTWDLDPKDKISPVKPGFPVLRKTGGETIDGMKRLLEQYGYLTDQDTLNDFHEVFMDQHRGNPQHSNQHIPDPGSGKTGEHAHLHDLPSFRLDYASLAEMGYDDAQIATLGRKVKKKGGIHPDLLAELVMDADGNPVYDSGDALVQALLAAPEPKTAVRDLANRIMLERHGELATPEAIGEAADMAAHNDLRLRVLATEYNALAQASGGARLVQSAARQLAAQAIGQKRIRDLSPAQYTRMETRAAKAALAAMKKGDIATAAAEKRNQVLQASLARAAHEAKVEVKKHALYLRRMNKLDPKTVAIEEREQIEALLERYNLRDQSGKALDRRQSLAEWVQAQREQGIEPDIAPEMLDELKRQPWQTLTVDELRGLVDTVRQIEHRGRTKNELLTARKKEDYNTAIENMVASIDAHARVSGIENRTPTTKAGKIKAAASRFFAAHLKTAMLARRLDGDTDGGALWEYLIRPANAAADRETTMRAEATAKLTEILAPRIRDRAANRKKSYTIAGKTRSFTHNDIFVMALNRGNEGNLQRLLGGENWEETDLAPLFAELTAADWQAVQAIWDYFETFRPAIAAKERRVNGVEPQWVAPTPFTVRSADGQIVEMRGGYYPIRYDTQASERAAEDDAASAVQAQMRGVHSAATTRRGHTKSRVQEVHNRPLVYNFAGIYSGFSDVIHDLAWHEYLIDANKLLRSTRLQNAVKDHYGTDILRQFKTWIQDIAVGDNETLAAGEDALRTVRRYASMAGLAFNVVSALKQPLGILQSVARVGGQDILGATAQFIRNPVAMTREAQGASVFMKNRSRTRFRELNELRNALEQQNTIRQAMGRYGYVLIMAVQQQVDVITWHAQLNKSLRAGADIQDAVAQADQAVIDSQGSGMTKDLAAIERGGEWRKLFTVYYGFMNTVLNLEVNALTAKRSLGYKAGMVLMLSVAMPIIDAALSDLLKPGDSDDWDEEHWQASVGKAVANSLTGHFFALRELQFGGRSYSGPTGTRSIADAYKLIEQTRQGELDDGFRRALINIAGSWYGLPSAQLNRAWDGFEALDDDKTDNPLALIFGYQEKK